MAHEFLIVPRFAVDRQKIVAVVEHDRPASHHRPFFEGEHVGIGPGFGPVVRDLELDPRIRPGRSVTVHVKQPNDSVGRLPHDAISVSAERRVRDDDRGRPLGRPFREPRAANPRIVAVLSRPPVIDEVEIAVGQLGDRHGMLIGVGEIPAENAFDPNPSVSRGASTSVKHCAATAAHPIHADSIQASPYPRPIRTDSCRLPGVQRPLQAAINNCRIQAEPFIVSLSKRRCTFRSRRGNRCALSGGSVH